MRILNLEAWYTIAARNICLAEERELDMLTICNGCNGTLFRVNEDLKMDSKLRMKINENLKEIGKKIKGIISVRSILRVLYEDVGLDKIKKNVKRPLNDIRVAVHYGCHIFDELKYYDDVKNPRSLKELVKVLGAEVISTPSEKLCCGSHIARCIGKNFSLELVKEKLNDLANVDADCLVVICPYCFSQYDLGQMTLHRKFKKEFQIPILYYPQLLGLAMGFDVRDMGLELHKVCIDKLIEKL